MLYRKLLNKELFLKLMLLNSTSIKITKNDNFLPLCEKLPKNPVKRNRVWEIDFLRGICIILMLVDHIMFNFAFLRNNTINYYDIENSFFSFMSTLGRNYWYWNVRVVIRNIVVGLFLFLSGISCTLTKSNNKRLLKLVTAASAVSFATYFLDLIIGHHNFVEIFILFGIIHLMAASLAIYIITSLAAGTGTAAVPVPAARLVRFIICLALAGFFIVGGAQLRFWDLSDTGVAFFIDIAFLEFYWWIVVAAFLFLTLFAYKFILKRIIIKSHNKQLADAIALIAFAAILIIGFILLIALLPIDSFNAIERQYFRDFIIGRGSVGSDFYGLFPFAGFFLAGAGFGTLAYSKKKSLLPRLHGNWSKLYSTIGKHGLAIYIVHMIVIFGLISMIAMMAGFRFW